MTELFENLPEEVKRQDKMFVDMAFLHADAKSIAEIVSNYIDSCADEEEKEFIDFCFKIKLQENLK